MRNIKMTLSYDGTAYHGFQDQGPGIPTIQRSLETAIHKLTGERLRVTGAGRTDAGVHALGQVINIRTSDPSLLNAVLCTFCIAARHSGGDARWCIRIFTLLG